MFSRFASLASQAHRGRGALGFALVVTVAIWATACGPAPLSAPRYAPVTAHIPGETPYTLVIAPIAATDQEMADTLAALEREPGLIQVLRSRTKALLGVDVFSAEDLAGTGVDVRGDVAIFGAGVQPAFLIPVRDPQRFHSFMETARTRRAEVTVVDQMVVGHNVHTVELGTARLSVTLLDEGYVLGVYHRDHHPAAEVLGPLLNMNPTTALGRTPFFADALAMLDPVADDVPALAPEDEQASAGPMARDALAIGVLNTAAFEVALQERAAARVDPRRALIPESRRGW